MRDIMRLLFGDDADGGEANGTWDGQGRRARVADSRDWCGSTPDEDAIEGLAAALAGRHGGRRRPMRAKRVSRPDPFGLS